MKQYYLYILASNKNGTLYTGLTNDLVKRVYEHRQNLVPGFTQKYNVHRLVYYEEFTDIHSAIAAEKRIKKWKRQWKINLIEKLNPQWRDLYPGLGSGLLEPGVPHSGNPSPRHSCEGRNPDARHSCEGRNPWRFDEKNGNRENHK